MMNLQTLIFAILLFKSLSCCSEGFFKSDQGCKPCDSSCRTCSEDTSCDSCEEFMTLDLTSSLCVHCADDKYYDTKSESCKSCMGTCLGVCSYRKTCMSCDPGQSLDIQTLECVDNCQVSQVKLEGLSLSVPSACRTPNYYVDPLSSEILELGTREYPYRTMKAVSSEILTFLSHQEINVIINVKDVHLEDNTLFALNMTELTIKSHPDYVEVNRKSLIILTEFTQVGISKKARFHLLESTSSALQTVISMGTFTEEEIILIQSPQTVTLALKGLTVSNVNLYRETEAPVKNALFCVPINLQEKAFTLEANLESGVDVDGLTFVASNENVWGRDPYLFTTMHPGNWTIKRFIAEEYGSSLSSFGLTFYFLIMEHCIPDDGKVQEVLLDDLRLSTKNREDKINYI